MPVSGSDERWLPVVGYEGLYSVSDRGRIRRDAPGKGTKAGRILVPKRMSSGYLRVCFGHANNTFLIHRVVVEAFIGPIAVGLVVNHIDAVRDNNNLVNLEIVTPLENVRHAASMGRHSRGENNGQSRLSASAVLEIRRLWSCGEQQKLIASKFGIAKQTVSGIVTRFRWKHI